MAAARSKRRGKARAAATERKAQPKGMISAWEDDPAAGNQPSGGQVIQRPVPVLRDQPLPIRIVHPASAPEAKPHPPGTAEFRYWTAAEALRRGADLWGALLPGLSWEVGPILPVDLDFGVDLNAFYDRVGLKFFHGVAAGRTVFSGESPDVVCHELGHALLDSFKPQLFDAASIEVAAFHESFGDMSALLSALQLPSVREGVLAETGGVLRRASRLSRLAEQLGWAIRQSAPSAVEPDCLRNAVNSFFYRDPDTLPTTAPATSLSSEPHSFSRVFTGAFFEGLAGMLATQDTRDEAALLQVSQDIGAILVQGIRAASVVPTFFSQVAASMLAVGASRFSAQGYEAPLRSGFVRHGVLPPSMAVAATHAPVRIAALAATSESKTLPTLQLSVAEYGLGVPSIVVYAAAEPKRLQVTGAALAVGAVPSPGEDQAAKSFFEDLLRRGRLKVAKAAKSAAEIVRAAAPSTHETHTHELRREGRHMVLRRVRIDCAFAHH
ncbi:MAG TPA: hypothetical protein VI010_16485 [Xanthobacteraceae bacterium]